MNERSLTRPAQLTRLMPVWRLAFRPLFLLGASFSLLAMLVWGGFWHGAILLEPVGGMIWWHQHEMLFGFVMAIVAGFLLTAVQNWTGQPSIKGWPLLGLVALWLAGRLLLAFPKALGDLDTLVIALVDLAFLPVVAAIMARLVMRVKQWRNLIFLPVLTLLFVANALMHAGVLRGDGELVRQGAYLAVLLIAQLIVILGGRVIPFFTSLRLKRQKPQPIPALEKLAIGSVAALVVTLLLAVVGLALPAIVTAVIALLAGAANLWRLARWEGWRALHEPLLWGLHVSYGFIALGLLMLGLAYLNLLPATLGIHALTVGGMSTMILAMISRVSLGHTGRPIETLPGIGLALGLMLAAALFRALIPAIWPQVTHWMLSLSILLWCLAYAVFLMLYTKPLLSARVDGKDG
ncbi:NnrS family protein [Halomonas sp. M20]|uniref:NnrS family protein n=1 Tax=Halomonas sp. M20 TaxID=2763264 RepID=UPI001D0AF048|nr:NnrS family protein [Halomonas sp. M20]